MKNLPFAFLAFGVLCIIVGMAYGIHMAIQQDFATAPAHAHLNLLGFVLSAIFAFYYHLVPSAQGPTEWAHFVVHAVSVVISFLIPKRPLRLPCRISGRAPGRYP